MVVDAWSARFAKMCGATAIECASLGVRFRGIGGGCIDGGGSGGGIGGGGTGNGGTGGGGIGGG
eukprot:4406097-Lingulodinium_polyedra.AAC.1